MSHSTDSKRDLKNLTLEQVAELQSDLMAHCQRASSLSDFYGQLGLTPDYFEAMYVLGLRDYQAGDFESARLHLSKLLRLQPNEPRFAKAMGATLQALQKFELALVHYLDALQARPGDLSVLLYSAQCLLMLKRQDDALRLLQALLVRPDAQAWHGQAHALLPLCASQKLAKGDENP